MFINKQECYNMPSTKATAAHTIQYSLMGSSVTEQSEGQGQSLDAGAAKRLEGLKRCLH